MPDPDDPLAAFYAAHPELAPGAPAGAKVGTMFAGGTPPPAAAGPKPGAAPAAPPPLPAGFVPSPTPGRGISHDGFTAVQLNPTTNQWQTVVGYAPSAAEKQAAGVNTTTPRSAGAGVNYAAQARPGDQTKDALLAAGGKLLGNNTIIMPNFDKYSAGTNGYFGPFGRASNADLTALFAQVRAGGGETKPGTPGTPPSTTQTLTSGMADRTSLAPGIAGTAPLSGVPGAGFLGANAGPIIPGMDAYRQAGLGIPSEGRQTIGGVSNGLNTMTAGRQGSATQTPVAPGFRREGDVGNSIAFASGNTSPGTLEPQMTFAPTSVSVPGTYVYGQGNTGAANQAYALPFNIGQGGAALANVGGNNVQINSADKSSGTGYVLNAMPASNVFALTGRNGSEDPASQAMQIAMMNAAIGQYGLGGVNAANPNQFGGNHAGTGNGLFSGNGGMGQGTFFQGYSPDPNVGRTDLGAWIFGGGGGGGYGDYSVDSRGMASGGLVTLGVPRRPLVGAPDGPKSMVTPEPIIGIGAITGIPRLIVGEDGTGDGVPDQERLTVGDGQMRVTPLHRPTPGFEQFDAGGTIYTGGPGGGQPNNPTAPPPDPAPEPTPPPVNGQQIPIDNGGVYTSPIPPSVPPQLPSLIPDYNALDPNILQPWQQALNQTAAQQYARDTYEYRRRAGGLAAERGVTALPGMDTSKPLGPGMFYDFQPQITQTISDIQGRQRELAGLGGYEDQTPIQQRATWVGNALDDISRIKQLQDARVAAEAKGKTPSQDAGNVASWNNELSEIQGQIDILRGSDPNINFTGKTAEEKRMMDGLTQRANELQYLIRSAQNQGVDSLDQQSIIDAQIQAIKDRIGNVNESDLRNELSQLQERMGRNEKRINLTTQVQNLAKLGVPNLSTPVAA